jgi:hypothetical protein
LFLILTFNFRLLSLSSRIVCLADSCQGQDRHNSVDLCDDPLCLNAKVSRSDLPTPHLPTHDVLKTRRVLQLREFGNVYRAAVSALQVSQEVMKTGVNPANVPDRWNAPGPTDARVDAEKDKIERQDGQAEATSSDAGKAQAIVPSVVYEASDQTTAAAKQGPESSRQRPRCISCNQIVSSPCWYCVMCPSMSAMKTNFVLALITDSLCRPVVSFRLRIVRTGREDWKQQSSMDTSSGAGTLRRPCT